MSNPDCKAGCGFICTCGEVDFSRENELAEENVKLRSQVTRLTAQNAIAMQALEKVSKERGCGCEFPCQCGSDGVLQIELDARMDVASTALSRIRELGEKE